MWHAAGRSRHGLIERMVAWRRKGRTLAVLLGGVVPEPVLARLVALDDRMPDRGGRRGVGTIAQCVTGRLATLEEIVDWQPYDHAGWRLIVSGLGPVDASADLEPTERGTRLRLRWAYVGGPPVDEGAIQHIRAAKEAAFARLGTVIAGSLPVVQAQEARP